MSDMYHGDNTQRDRRVTDLLKILSKQYDTLVAAHCSPDVLKAYAGLLRFLRLAKKDDIDRIFSGPRHPLSKQREHVTHQTELELNNLPLDEAEKLVNDERTPRKYLERIAIHRFSIPKGSMRSYSNRQLLVDKLLTAIRNERTHTTIDLVARAQAGKQS